MTDEMRIVWNDLVAQSKKNILADDPSRGDEAIVQADNDLRSVDLQLARVGYQFQIMETRLHNILNKGIPPVFTAEEMAA